MIAIRDVLVIHEEVIKQFGGSSGVRDIALLESALARPFATFDEIDLYPTAVSKAAALLESLLINHPFIDGNKRTAYVMMRMLLLDNGFDIRAAQHEKYDFVISICTGERRGDQIGEWLKERLEKM